LVEIALQQERASENKLSLKSFNCIFDLGEMNN
jgi:hypothetical protein